MRARTAALTRREHRRLADVLLRAADDRRPIPPLSESYPELTAADAARIRDTAIVKRIAEGEQLVGAKVSLGSSANGRAPDEPRLGWLTDGMILSGPELDLADLIHPRLEAKVAFQLAQPLRGRIGTVGDLLSLTARVLPCLEIVDVRYQGTDLDRVDDIADNCAAASLLIGEGVPKPPADDLLSVRVHVECSPSDSIRSRLAERISPVEATLWLANRVIEEAGELEPGAFLVSSACAHSVQLRPGVRVTADFESLGDLELETTSDVRV
jgi:2-keto-4-pentenoate hydratase